MAWRTGFEFVVICAVIGVQSPSNSVLAQKVVVDATPSHMVNAFSPIRALGAGVDRLRSGEGAPEMDRLFGARLNAGCSYLLRREAGDFSIIMSWQLSQYLKNVGPEGWSLAAGAPCS